MYRFCFGIALHSAFFLVVSAHAVVVKDISSGIDDATSTQLANDAPDTDYVLVVGSGTGAPPLQLPVVAARVGEVPIARSTPLPFGFVNDTASAASRWIVINSGQGGTGIEVERGTYFFETSVDLTGVDPTTAQITGLRYAADDKMNEVFVNDVSVWQRGSRVSNDDNMFFNIGDVGLGAFQSGINRIRFDVSNEPGGNTPLGLRVEGAVVAASPPVAADDAYQAVQGQTLNVGAPGVLANDTDAESDPLTVVIQSVPTGAASFTLNPDGSFTYVSLASFFGTDSFTYTASDGTGQSNVATVTIDVSAPPVAADDAFQVQTEQSLAVNAPGVLSNDSDLENDPLTAVLVSGPGNAASFALLADGSFSYTPNAGFIGTDTFTYTADDGGNTSNTATVTIDVTPDPLECLDLLRGPADAYEALAQNSLTQQIPAIQALLSAGDLAGATALQQSTINTLVQEAGNAAAATQAECANCVATLQANGNADLIPTVNNACVEQTHRIGTLQASATAELESVITPASPAPIAMLMRDRYTREISVNTQSTAVSADRYADRYTAIIHRFMARGNTAAADGAAAQARVVLQRSTAARAARIRQLCDNFVTRAARMPGTHLLIAEVTAAANAAMAELRAAESEALQQITAARAA